MDKPAAWRELAARFKDVSRYDLFDLRAHWRSEPYNNRGEHWIIAGGDPHGNEVMGMFMIAGERAGVLLGYPPGRSAVFAWLDHLRAESYRYNESGSTMTVKDGITVTAQTGTIHSLCSACEEECYRLETKGIAGTAQVFSSSRVDVQRPMVPETISQQIERLRLEADWTIEVLAEKMGISERTVRRHLSECTMPPARLIARYKRIFSNRLNREVVIRKLS